MAGNIGRSDALKKNNVVIAGVRDKNISWAGEAIDNTSAEDGGIRQLLSEYGQQQLTISGSGVYKDDETFRLIALNPATSGLLTDVTYEFANGDVISGDVLLTSYNETGPYKESTTFDFTLEFSSNWTLTQV